MALYRYKALNARGEVLDGQMEQVAEICRSHGAVALELARSEAEREILWKARRGGTAALVRHADFLVTLDYAVPISCLPVSKSRATGILPKGKKAKLPMTKQALPHGMPTMDTKQSSP